MSKRYAVIEIGTRGLRLLVADASPLGIERTVYSTGDLSELGRNQTAKGAITKDSISRTKAIIHRYLEVAKEHKSDQIAAFATEVIRSAKNRRAFLKEMSSIIEVQVLRREEEALYSFIASINAFRHNIPSGKTVMVIDQGGGSTELSCGLVRPDGMVILQDYDTLSLGTVGVTTLFAQSKILKDGFDKVDQVIRREIEQHGRFVTIASNAPAAVFGLGSAITTLAERLNPKRNLEKKSSWHLHGQFIDIRTIHGFIEKTRTTLSRAEVSGMRLEADSDLLTLLGGILTYYYILTKYKAPGITISRWGLRYGVLISQAGQPSLVQQVSGEKADLKL